ncbi:MAG: OmpA family protein, partial [Psychrilyobacter sp.]|uniref:OmpA family protein n=1 Tax=Psychrilyobacter sp. TaxID=2586924 RepID=UPI003C725D65
MKKILLGLLVVGALSACSSSEEKADIPMQIQTLNETVDLNANTLTDVKNNLIGIKATNRKVKAQLEEAQQKAAVVAGYIQFVKAFENTGAIVTEVDKGLYLALPGSTTFESSKAVLNDNIKTILEPLSEALRYYSGTNLIIRGHTDNSGTEKFNQKLSEDRSIAVSTYLTDKG